MNGLSRFGLLCALAVLVEPAICSQTPETLAVAADSPRWELQGEARAIDYLGRKCLSLNGGAAVLSDFELRDGVAVSRIAFTLKSLHLDDHEASKALLTSA